MGKKDLVNKECIQKFKEGDLNSFNIIFEVYKDALYYFALSVVKNPTDAEDVVQEAFVKALRGIRNLNNLDSFHSWINTIVYHQAINILKKNKKIITFSDGRDYVINNLTNEETSSQLLDKKDIVSAVQFEIEQLPAKLVQIAYLHYIANFSLSEISRILSIPESTVRHRVTKIKKILQSNLSNKGYEPTYYFSMEGLPIMVEALETLIRKNSLSDQSIALLKEIIIQKQPGNLLAQSSGMDEKKQNHIRAFIIAPFLLIGCIVGLYQVNHLVNQNEISTMNINVERSPFKNTSYDKAITRDPIEVATEISSLNENDKVEVTFNHQMIDFSIQGKTLTFLAEKNGKYSLSLNGQKKNIEIMNIDQFCPKIENVSYSDEYIHLNILDEKAKVNYETSYAMCNQTRYEITEDGNIYVSEDGKIDVYLIDYDENIIQYQIIQK